MKQGTKDKTFQNRLNPQPVTYDIDVIGYIWSGPQSSYSYRITSPDIPTAQQVKSKAGDFSIIDDYRITTTHRDTVRTEKQIVTTIICTLAKDWTDASSGELFDSMQ